MKDTDIVLGEEYVDKITGFAGVAVGLTFWLHACERVGLQSAKLTKDGKVADLEWFDIPGVDHVKTKVTPKTTKTGGPPARGVEAG
ncbi:hypothetical protein LCGC14_1122090 [marine sediment metagenome]|uniref:Uncharacterized protein n=1 Tax=marine sediment metagenome TaxID=412755 RepID=A0A0F9M8F3_9ZZZZ